MKNKADYSQYKCPYSHLEKDCGHKLHGPEGYEETYGVWCPCGFRGPVFYLDPEELKLEKLESATEIGAQNTAHNRQSVLCSKCQGLGFLTSGNGERIDCDQCN